jgi:hypothetical protein
LESSDKITSHSAADLLQMFALMEQG